MRAAAPGLWALIVAVVICPPALISADGAVQAGEQQVSLNRRGLSFGLAPQWPHAASNVPWSTERLKTLRKPDQGWRSIDQRTRSRDRKSHVVKAQAHSPQEPDRERSIANWERQFPKPGDPNGKMPFKVYGIDRDSPEYFKGPPHDRQFFPECEGAGGKCKPGTTTCRIPVNWSEELGHRHPGYGRPCECENLDRCAVHPEEGFRDCDCPSRTVRSRWDYEVGEPRL